MNYKAFLIALLLLISSASTGQTLSIHELNQKLGKGINMGNMFEAPSETEWGNPFRDDYLEKITNRCLVGENKSRTGKLTAGSG